MNKNPHLDSNIFNTVPTPSIFVIVDSGPNTYSLDIFLSPSNTYVVSVVVTSSAPTIVPKLISILLLYVL